LEEEEEEEDILIDFFLEKTESHLSYVKIYNFPRSQMTNTTIFAVFLYALRGYRRDQTK